jgi:multicomponent Na+:H+ antiporter subunit D
VNLLVVLPLVIPLVAAVLALVAWRAVPVQRVLTIVASVGHLTASGVLLWRVSRDGVHAVQMGAWPAPYGITLVADLLGAIMLVLASMMGAAIAIYSLAAIDPPRERFGYHPLLLLLLTGVSGAFLTGDIFNLFVWFEVLLMASFVLMALGGERFQIEGGLKYVTLNLISSLLFLTAVGILYGAAGTLNMADLARRLAENGETAGIVQATAMLFLVAFGIKSAVFPVFFWLPASYHAPPIPVAALFAGLLTKVGVYALIRVFTLLFTDATWYTHGLLLVIAGLTMITGVLGAVAQSEIRRILSFHIISQIGYMVMGLALFSPLGLAGSIFYVIHHIVVKTNLFLIAGIIRRTAGSYDLKVLGGLYRSHPWLAVLFLIPAMSLAGLPPLSGFFAKLALIQAGLGLDQYAIVAVALLVGLLTLFSMMKIWNEAFWKMPEATGTAADVPEPVPAPPLAGAERVSLLVPAVGLALVTLTIGVGAESVFQLSLRAAEQLLDGREYIAAVLEVAR